jgi:hypothetical protein
LKVDCENPGASEQPGATEIRKRELKTAAKLAEGEALKIVNSKTDLERELLDNTQRDVS